MGMKGMRRKEGEIGEVAVGGEWGWGEGGGGIKGSEGRGKRASSIRK